MELALVDTQLFGRLAFSLILFAWSLALLVFLLRAAVRESVPTHELVVRESFAYRSPLRVPLRCTWLMFCLILAVCHIAIADPVWTYALSCLIVVAMTANVVQTRRDKERLYKRVRACEYRVCPRCEYDLGGVTRGSCRECGRPFTLRELREYWAGVLELMR